MQYPNFPVGYGRLSNGDTQAYVLTPCEENHGRGEGCGEGGGENVVLQTSPARGYVPTTTLPSSLTRRLNGITSPAT